jgi:hypothetical protein
MQSNTSRESRETCVLVVDANILVKDFWWDGPSSQHLISRLFLMHTVVVPELALLEASAEIERRASDLLERIKAAGSTPRLLAQYQRLFRKTTIDNESGGSLAKRYERFVNELVLGHGGIVAPTPDVKVSEVIQRSVKRIKPFNRGDKGFRDTLLWLGVLDLVRRFRRVSFVSANTNDFSLGKNRLHPELEREVNGVLPENIRFRYFPSLDEFVAEMDPGGEGGAEALLRAILDKGFRGFDLLAWLQENLENVLSTHEFDGVDWAGMPYWAEDPRVTEIEEVVAFEPCNASSIGGSRVQFYCHIAVVATYSCSILYASWRSVLPSHQVLWVDEESDDVWTEVGVRSVGTFTMRFVFDLDIASVSEYEIVALEHDFDGAISALEEIQSMHEADDD